MRRGQERALFLDRDGVINVDLSYVHSRDQFHFLPGIFDLCRAARDCGFLIAVVTNQAGIGRGYYSERDFHELSRWMLGRFLEERVHVAGIYYCPCHPVHGRGAYRRECECRKPNPGLLLRAASDLGVDLGRSVMIGDQAHDMQAAAAAGVGTGILLRDPATDRSLRHADVWYREASSLSEIARLWFGPSSAGFGAGGPQMMDAHVPQVSPCAGLRGVLDATADSLSVALERHET
ncbi:MAG: HAD family hydrolase [Bryobacterales bacterium]|nr:HAD family hydrolase [Bryobacterales bacterium]